MLYEEKVSSKWILSLIFMPIMISVLFGIWATYQAGEDIRIPLAVGALVIPLIIDGSYMRIQIDDREIRIRGALGLIIRKTIKLEDIISFEVHEGWMSCPGFIHFNMPAKGCVVLNTKRWSVSFSTNNPEEIAQVLATLGIPREASNL
ncbi:hypothetical protein E3E31_04080 [Thermococcus sp. M39]|uniref:hypothetical protein n=1 Tax=unclassified Thermococcus TaxID=2627626 RepID=UPI0014395546|nr:MULTISPECIES: hypothetical protein [unclassified Thermococcus]NJE07707.1 hypothetical protein [Thermococcus sp. M39]NJE12263.1 hypothetical protein [Thermococcus sp. LS2]